jgi:hypothetical protein
MYEGKEIRPLSQPHFIRRMVVHLAMAIGVVGVSAGIGMWGYSYFESLPWRDGFLNSAMLLGGMGPVNAPQSNGGKLFAAFYALYAGLIFIVVTGLTLAPVVHRLLHRFHWSDDQGLS